MNEEIKTYRLTPRNYNYNDCLGGFIISALNREEAVEVATKELLEFNKACNANLQLPFIVEELNLDE